MSDKSSSFNLSSRNRIVLFLLIGLVLMIGLGSIHLFDWDEINFAESSREMIVSGDFLHVQVNFSPFWEKPPLFMWLQCLAMSIFGITEFAARFPNALFGVIYLFTFYLIGKKHHGKSFGLLWGLIFISSILPFIYFKSGVIDPIFNYFIFTSIYFMILTLSEDENKNRNAIISGLLTGLGLLTKGPVGFLLLGLTLFIFLLLKRFKGFPSFKSIALYFITFIGTISIWILWEYLANGSENIWKFIIYQAELFNSNVAGHEQPFYYHFFVVFIGCFPMSILALPAFKTKYLDDDNELRKWMLILFWVVLILFSIVTTKIIHYSSMTYVPLSYLATTFIYFKLKNNEAISKSILILYAVLGILIGVTITVLIYIFQHPQDFMFLFKDKFTFDSMRTPVNWYGFEFLIGILFILSTLLTAYLLQKKQIERAVYLFLGTIAICFVFIQLMVIPKIEKHTQGPLIEMCESIKEKDVYIATIGFKSYAHYFYGEIKPKAEKHKDQKWLLEGKIDKPVYFLTKSNVHDLSKYKDLKLISSKGGYRMYFRDVK